MFGLAWALENYKFNPFNSKLYKKKLANKETKLFNCRNQIPCVLIARILLQMSVTAASVFRISEPSLLRTRLWPQ